MYSSHYNLLGILLAYDPTVKETKSSNPCGVCAAELLEYAHDVGRTGTFRLLIAPAFAMWLCSWAPPMQKQSLSNSAHPGWGTENNSVCKVRTGRRGWGCHFYRARCPATSSLPPLRDCPGLSHGSAPSLVMGTLPWKCHCPRLLLRAARRMMSTLQLPSAGHICFVPILHPPESSWPGLSLHLTFPTMHMKAKGFCQLSKVFAPFSYFRATPRLRQNT